MPNRVPDPDRKICRNRCREGESHRAGSAAFRGWIVGLGMGSRACEGLLAGYQAWCAATSPCGNTRIKAEDDCVVGSDAAEDGVAAVG